MASGESLCVILFFRPVTFRSLCLWKWCLASWNKDQFICVNQRFCDFHSSLVASLSWKLSSFIVSLSQLWGDLAGRQSSWPSADTVHVLLSLPHTKIRFIQLQPYGGTPTHFHSEVCGVTLTNINRVSGHIHLNFDSTTTNTCTSQTKALWGNSSFSAVN